MAVWAWGVAAVLALNGCGSSSSSGDGQVRLINATRTHPSIDMLANGTKSISAVAQDAASSYVALAAASYTLQVTDAGQQTALAASGPSVTKDQNFTLLAYESNGTVKAAWLSENDTAPTAGSASLRVFNAATDAGALDVYVTAPGADLSTAGVTFTLTGQSTVQTTSFLTFAPGNYQVRVTGSGNRNDLRLNIPSVTLANQNLATVILTPTTGGTLVDGATVIQKGAYVAARNSNARVRVVSGVVSGVVTASRGGVSVEPGAASPYIGTYVTVPAGTATWSINIGNVAAAVPPITLAAGSDNMVLVTGTPAAPVAKLVLDDNHAPALSTNVSMRLVNGLSGTTTGLSMAIDFAVAATNVLPGAASDYKSLAGNSNMRLEVTSPLSLTPISLQTGLNIPPGGVYSIFVLGDVSAPQVQPRKDR